MDAGGDDDDEAADEEPLTNERPNPDLSHLALRLFRAESNNTEKLMVG